MRSLNETSYIIDKISGKRETMETIVMEMYHLKAVKMLENETSSAP